MKYTSSILLAQELNAKDVSFCGGKWGQNAGKLNQDSVYSCYMQTMVRQISGTRSYIIIEKFSSLELLHLSTVFPFLYRILYTAFSHEEEKLWNEFANEKVRIDGNRI